MKPTTNIQKMRAIPCRILLKKNPGERITPLTHQGFSFTMVPKSDMSSSSAPQDLRTIFFLVVTSCIEIGLNIKAAITPATMQHKTVATINRIKYCGLAMTSTIANPRLMNTRKQERMISVLSLTCGLHGWAVKVTLQVGDHDVVKFPHIASCIRVLEFVKQIVLDGKGSEGNMPK